MWGTRGSRCGLAGGDEGAILGEHLQSPAENDAKGQDKEQARRLLDGHDGVEVSPGKVADCRESDDHDEKGPGAVHDDFIAPDHKPGGHEQGPGKQNGTDQKRDRGPKKRHPERRNQKHAESGAHAERRDENLADGYGGSRLADSPNDYADEAQYGDKGGSSQNTRIQVHLEEAYS